MIHDYDLIIVGRGLAGTNLALALQHLPLRIAMLDNKPNSTPDTNSNNDMRPITLNHTSQQILSTLNQWSSLQTHAKTIEHLQISEQGRLGQINLQAKALKLPALGYVLPFNQLQQTVQTALSTHTQITYIQVDRLTDIHNDNNGATVDYIDLQQTPCSISTPLLIVADGTNSTCRQLLQIQSDHQDHGDKALIFEATLAPSQQPSHTAYQRFTSKGSLAWLPSWQPNRARLVWTLSKRNLSTIDHYTEQDTLQHFNSVYQGRTATITSCKKTGDFPLSTMYVSQPTQASVILIGNAAHSIYPITAQGFNLTLLNIAILAEVLTETYQSQQTLGNPSALQRYQTWSACTQKNIIQSTHTIDALFGFRLPLAGHLRGLGMLVTDLCSFGKRHLAHQFLGYQEQMPKLACNIPLATLSASSTIAEEAEIL